MFYWVWGMSVKPPKLTAKQQKFIDEYFLCGMNAAEAARRSGYSPKTARIIGAENLSKPIISAEIKRRFTEKHVSADEVLARLADMSRSDIADFAHVESGADISKLKGKSHVIKKFKRKITYTKDDSKTEEIELELYDAQAALLNIGKQHGLFSDKHVVEMRLEKEIDVILDKLEQLLPSELYDSVLSAISGTEAGEGTLPSSPANPEGE